MNIDDQIKELIKNHNPFAGKTIVQSRQIWENTFPDVPTINNHASDAVFSALELINSGERPNVVGITIIGERGSGKSSVISRIRQRLQQKENSGIFIYVGEYSGKNVKSVFLKRLSESMKKTGSMPGITQWQEIATHLVNETFEKKENTAEKYIRYFTEIPKPEFNLQKRIQEEFNLEKRIKKIMQVRPELHNPYLIRGILLTLVPKYSDYAVRWLAGQELTEKQLSVMNLADQELTEEQLSEMDLVPPVKDEGGEAFNQACELLKIISKYKTPVICFDELDVLNMSSSKKLSHIVASLGKELSNSLERCILLFAMYPKIWTDEIMYLPQVDAVVDRIANYPKKGKPVDLDLKGLNGDDVFKLVSTWLKNFYQEHKINPPNDLHPFTEEYLINLGKERLNVRKVLSACADYWNSLRDPQDQTENQVTENNLVKKVKGYFNDVLAEVNSEIDLINDNDAISNALNFCFAHLVGETIEDFKIEKIESLPTKSKLGFKISGLDHDTRIIIGVVVAQDSNMKTLGSILKELINYDKYQLTRGCLVRSKKPSETLDVAKKRKVDGHLNTLLHKQGGEWADFKQEDISQIIALQRLYQKYQSYDLTEEQILEFAKQEKIITDNHLVKEILSAPPGKEPDNLIDEDADLEVDNLTDEVPGLETDNLTDEVPGL
jgi:Cdc6-like AAA superfamily ATPase